MFENAGNSVKTLATVVFIIALICAAVLFFVGLAFSDLLLLYWLLAAAVVLNGIIMGYVLTAIGDAAVNSEVALKKVYELSRKNDNVNVAEMGKDGSITAKTASYDNYGSRAQKNGSAEHIPAWKRVQMEQERFKPGKCEMCGDETKQVADCEIRDELGIRYRKLCQECMAKSNAVFRK